MPNSTRYIQRAPIFATVLCLLVTAVPQGKSQIANPPAQDNPAASPSPVEVDGCVDRKDGKLELTNNLWWVLYYLTGQTAGLENHIGDEVKVRGVETQPVTVSPQGRRPPTLQVTSVEFMVHKNPEGVRPVLGNLDTWVSYDNPQYGFRVRYPATFGLEGSMNPGHWPNFAGQDPSAAVRILGVNIPRNTFPDSNFVEGAFAIFIDPNIRSEGTCRQFATIWPERTASTNIGRASYARTMQDGVATGTDYSSYNFHTFQNGLCYEFTFEFAEGNGGGMDIPCSIQWVSEDNNFELMNGVLSAITYKNPLFKSATAEAPSQKLVPSVISFEHGGNLEQPAGVITVGVSWKTANADYVQIRYPCTKFLYASTTQPTTYGLGACGETTDVNLPPNGSMSLLLGNFNPQPVKLVLTIEPFLAGKGYAKESQTISITAPPTPHAPLPEEQKQ